ncbi:MAG: AtpZ/AtpI family protein [Phycisphaerae bacterium]|nr:AtpZ/AtpI family protein [Gemmatimonadaceae bacterium]
MTSKLDPPGSTEPDVNPMRVAGLGVQFAAALIGFGYLGQWLDGRFNSAPIFLMIGVFFGGGGTFYLSYRRLMAPRPPK